MENEPMNPTQTFERMKFPEGMEVPKEYFQNLELEIEGEHLTGVKIAEDLSKPSDFVFFHGAAGGNWSRLMGFIKPVVEQGSSIVAFDHSGHGTSSGTEKKSSLAKKIIEANAIIDNFANRNPKTVCGSSMGAYTAIKMLEKYPVQNLILFCPGIYDRQAINIRFDSGFTEMIRRPESWKNTDAAEILEKFQGNLLVLIGSKDNIIPRGVIELIDQHSPNTKKKEILNLEGAPHGIQAWMIANPDRAQEIANKIAEFSL